MKNFKDLLSEVAQPKSAEEKRFKDQHTIELIKHPVAPEHVHTGEIEGVTMMKRSADPAKGEDAAKYDAAYAVKDKPFKMPRNIDESAQDEEPVKSSLSFKGLLEKVALEDFEDSEELVEAPEYVSEDPQEEVPMMMRQLHFIAYAADEIMEYLAMGDVDPEEWYQNKLANAFSMMKTLHAYVEGDKRMGDEDDLRAGYMMSGYYGEETELEEANFKPSNLKLKSGETVKISMADAKTLNDMMKTLNPKNRKEMEATLMKDKKGFEEVLGFAKEAM